MASNERPHRVFAGIMLTFEVASELVQIAQELEHPSVRLIAVDDIHLTLLAPWPEHCIPDAVQNLQRVAADVQPFTLLIEHVGYGPDRRNPRLLWATCHPSDELVSLRNALLLAFQRTDKRPFQPHVTLARIRHRGRSLVRKHPIDRQLSLTQRVESIELIRSPVQDERGYRIIASVSLGKRLRSPPSALCV